MTTYPRRLTDGPRGELIDDACRARRRRRRTKRKYFDMLRERYGDLADIERERIRPARPPVCCARRAAETEQREEAA